MQFVGKIIDFSLSKYECFVWVFKDPAQADAYTCFQSDKVEYERRVKQQAKQFPPEKYLGH